jgi:hypothetical protein
MNQTTRSRSRLTSNVAKESISGENFGNGYHKLKLSEASEPILLLAARWILSAISYACRKKLPPL